MVFRKMPLLPKLYKFYRDHGISKTLRCLLLFYYRRLKRLLTNFAKEHVIEVNGYKLSTIPNDRGWYADELILFKTHEPLATELLKKELKKEWSALISVAISVIILCLSVNSLEAKGEL